MYPLRAYPFLRELLSPFRRSQQKTLAWVIAAIAEAGEAGSRRLAGALARRSHILLGSALNRYYRLLRNRRIEDRVLSRQMLSLLGSTRTLVIPLDWTEWPKERRMLLASMVVGKRAVPVQAQMDPTQQPRLSRPLDAAPRSRTPHLDRGRRRRHAQVPKQGTPLSYKRTTALTCRSRTKLSTPIPSDPKTRRDKPIAPGN